eukprot:COSAG05_NODE_435_length_9845_cov_24.433364_2_plen_598_part_00
MQALPHVGRGGHRSAPQPGRSLSQEQLHRISTSADAGPYALNLSHSSRPTTTRDDRVSVSDRLRVSSKPLVAYPEEGVGHGTGHSRVWRRKRGKKTDRQRWVEQRRRSLMPYAVRRMQQRSLPDLSGPRAGLTPPPLATTITVSGARQLRAQRSSSGSWTDTQDRPQSTESASEQAVRLSRSISTDLSNVLTTYPATRIVHVRGIGQDPSKRYHGKAALVELFSKYGTCLDAQVRGRVDESGEDTSWAFVVMENELGVEKAVHAKVMAGEFQLTVSRYSQKVASTSEGSMGRVAAKMDNNYFAKAARVADARVLLEEGQKLLLRGQEMHMAEIIAKGREWHHSGGEGEVQPEDSVPRKVQFWIRAAEKFETARDLDPSCGKARLACRQAKRMIEEERQTQKRLARFKLFRKKYGEDWQAAMNMEQDPASISQDQLREVFEMVDVSGDGTLDRDEIEILINFFNSGVEVTEQEVDEAMSAMDGDGSGEVDFDEFNEWFVARGSQKKEQEQQLQNQEAAKKATTKAAQPVNDEKFEATLKTIFDKYDDDGSGEIDASELGEIMASLGHEISAEEASTMVDEIDLDGYATHQSFQHRRAR